MRPFSAIPLPIVAALALTPADSAQTASLPYVVSQDTASAPSSDDAVDFAGALFVDPSLDAPVPTKTSAPPSIKEIYMVAAVAENPAAPLAAAEQTRSTAELVKTFHAARWGVANSDTRDEITTVISCRDDNEAAAIEEADDGSIGYVIDRGSRIFYWKTTHPGGGFDINWAPFTPTDGRGIATDNNQAAQKMAAIINSTTDLCADYLQPDADKNVLVGTLRPLDKVPKTLADLPEAARGATAKHQMQAVQVTPTQPRPDTAIRISKSGTWTNSAALGLRPTFAENPPQESPQP